MNRCEIKRLSREQLGGGILKNNWLMAVVVVLIVSAVTSIGSSIPVVPLLLAGPLGVGTAIFFKNVVRSGSARVESLFEGFTKDFGGALVLGLMQSIFVALWSLLFVIPGIVKGYAYSMAFYLKSEHEDWDWRRCLDESQKLMNGHKAELFILDLSFIGWYIVGSLILGIGALWVQAYHTTARINYFESITSIRVE